MSDLLVADASSVFQGISDLRRLVPIGYPPCVVKKDGALYGFGAHTFSASGICARCGWHRAPARAS